MKWTENKTDINIEASQCFLKILDERKKNRRKKLINQIN